MYTSFAAQRQRVLLKYSLADGVPVPFARSGSAAIVQRMDDDRLIAYQSISKRYISESRKLILSKLLLDPWKKSNPEASETPTPELSEEQRTRLGAEVRATYTPFIKKYFTTYFAPSPKPNHSWESKVMATAWRK